MQHRMYEACRRSKLDCYNESNQGFTLIELLEICPKTPTLCR